MLRTAVVLLSTHHAGPLAAWFDGLGSTGHRDCDDARPTTATEA